MKKRIAAALALIVVVMAVFAGWASAYNMKGSAKANCTTITYTVEVPKEDWVEQLTGTPISRLTFTPASGLAKGEKATATEAVPSSGPMPVLTVYMRYSDGHRTADMYLQAVRDTNCTPATTTTATPTSSTSTTSTTQPATSTSAPLTTPPTSSLPGSTTTSPSTSSSTSAPSTTSAPQTTIPVTTTSVVTDIDTPPTTEPNHPATPVVDQPDPTPPAGGEVIVPQPVPGELPITGGGVSADQLITAICIFLIDVTIWATVRRHGVLYKFGFKPRNPF